MTVGDNVVRVAIYGCGRWANRTHIPSLQKIEGVEVVALCDADPMALASTAQRYGIAHTYGNGHEMLENEAFDALFSIVPAYARTDVEIDAASRRVHIFSEKPQATSMSLARRIDEAIDRAGVVSTVGFRERYRPLFQEARRRLAGREIVHVRFQSYRRLPGNTLLDGPAWSLDMDKAGGGAFDWGVHAVDYVRFITGLDVVQAQAFYLHRPEYRLAISQSLNCQLSNGATMTLSFVRASENRRLGDPPFMVLYEGGHLSITRFERGGWVLESDGETIYSDEDFDPWLEQDRLFIEAVRAGDDRALLNDYHDGLLTLAPILACWESSRRNGECIDVKAFMGA